MAPLAAASSISHLPPGHRPPVREKGGQCHAARRPSSAIGLGDLGNVTEEPRPKRGFDLGDLFFARRHGVSSASIAGRTESSVRWSAAAFLRYARSAPRAACRPGPARRRATGASGCAALRGLDLLLAGQLFLQRERGRGGAAGFLDLAVELLDLALQADLQVVGPAVELFGLGLEEAGVALGDAALDGGLPLLR